VRFSAALNTTIYDVHYAQGEEVDVSGWTRTQVLQFLGNGLIQGMQLRASDVADVIEFFGDGIQIVVDQGQITLTALPQRLDWLTDVNLGAAPADGEALVWDEAAQTWRSGTPVATPPGGTLAYAFTQAVASNLWIIDHPLSFVPQVTVVDSGGTVVWGTVAIVSPSRITVSFTTAFSGTAYLS
jgi:hypothetical protein